MVNCEEFALNGQRKQDKHMKCNLMGIHRCTRTITRYITSVRLCNTMKQILCTVLFELNAKLLTLNIPNSYSLKS